MSLFIIQVYTNYDPLQTNNIQIFFQNINMTYWVILVLNTKKFNGGRTSLHYIQHGRRVFCKLIHIPQIPG